MIEKSSVRVPAGAAGKIVFSMVYFSVLTLILKFLLHGLLFCADSYFGIRSTAVLPQWHIKGPGHSAKSAGGRLQLNTHASQECGFA